MVNSGSLVGGITGIVWVGAVTSVAPQACWTSPAAANDPSAARDMLPPSRLDVWHGETAMIPVI